MTGLTRNNFWRNAAKLMLTGIVLPCILLLCLELVAGMAGAGYPTQLFIKETGTGGNSSLRVNYQAGYRFFPGTLARKPLPETMPASKPADRLRIFVLGESAARGEQLADFSFARMLEASFNDGSPGKKVEVINTGIPAINSWVLREFARELVNYQPDLIIIYAGHNEFIGPYGPAGVFGLARNRFAALAGIWASSLHLVQMLKGDRVPPALAAGWQGLEMFLNNLISPDDPAIDLCLSNWQANLNDIFAYAKAAGVPTIWCRVPVNQLDCPPFASDEKHFDSELRASVGKIRNSIENADYQSALTGIDAIRGRSGRHALLNYLEGKAQLAIGKHETARQCFRDAVSNDCFKVRTTDQFNDAAAACASQSGAFNADIENLFMANSQNGIIGGDLVYDHVHLTLKGHYLAAAGIFRSIAANVPALASKLPAVFPAFEEITAMVGFTDHDAVENLTHITASMNRPPFTLQPENSAKLRRFAGQLEAIRQNLNLDHSIEKTRAAISRQPENWAALHRLAMLCRQSPVEARLNFEKSLALNPFNIDAINNYGLLLLATEQTTDAEQQFLKALRLAPDFARAHYNLGVLYSSNMSDRANAEKAAEHYRLATSADPGLLNAWRNLANLHFRSGNFELALAVYNQAIKVNSDDVLLQIGAGNCLLKLEKFDESIRAYEQAIASFPASPMPLHSQALAFEKLQRFADAALNYQKAGQMGYLEAYKKLFELHFSQKISLSKSELIGAADNSCKLSDFSDPWFMQVLAAGYLENGQKSEAAGILHRALALARSQGQQALAAEIENNLKLAITN